MEADRRRSVRNVRRSFQPRSLVQRTLPEGWLIVLFLPNLHRWFIRLPPRREPPCLSSLRVSESTFVSLHIHSDVPWKRTSSATVVPACHWAGVGLGLGRGRGCVRLNTVQRFSMSLIKTSYYQSDAEAFISKTHANIHGARVCCCLFGKLRTTKRFKKLVFVFVRYVDLWMFFFPPVTFLQRVCVRYGLNSVVLPITPVLLHLAYNSVCLFMCLWVSRKSNCRHHKNEATHMVAEELK